MIEVIRMLLPDQLSGYSPNGLIRLNRDINKSGTAKVNSLSSLE
ncbi:hypothetical protein [Paenibacillus sp. PastH-2]|nr:hypothetical protein [Paenibacillus sp. PastH-2]MDH6480790.1 hypothetical protein [Paenibacillus sp. PastH-2]